MFRHEFVKTIHDLKIPHSQIASCAKVVPARVSDYVRNRPLTTGVSVRIEEAITKMSYVLSTFRRYSPELKIVLDSPKVLDQMVGACQTFDSSELSESDYESAEITKQLEAASAEAINAIRQLATL